MQRYPDWYRIRKYARYEAEQARKAKTVCGRARAFWWKWFACA